MSGLSRRCFVALAVAALLGLGTVGLHHLYVDAMGGGEAAHDCLTCRVVGSSVALLGVMIATITACHVFPAPSFPSLGIEHAGFAVRLGSRAPPTGFEPLAARP